MLIAFLPIYTRLLWCGKTHENENALTYEAHIIMSNASLTHLKEDKYYVRLHI